MAGWVKTNFDIKIIILYILSKVPEPLAFDEILDVAQCEEGINYFLLKQSIDELLIPENVAIDDALYSITPRGSENLSNLIHLLPDSVRSSCDEQLSPVIRNQNTRKYVKSNIIKHSDNTSEVHLELLDSRGILMDLTLITANVKESEQISTTFHQDPSRFFKEVMNNVRIFSGLNP